MGEKIKNQIEYLKQKEGKQKPKTHTDSVDLLNIEDITNINNITNIETIKKIIENLISKGSSEKEELNQCSFIDDADAKAKCEAALEIPNIEKIKNEIEYLKYKEGKQKHKTHKHSVDLLN